MKGTHMSIEIMEFIKPTGILCLGAVVGWLVRYFLLRFEEFTPTIMGTTVSIVLGTGVVKFLGDSKDIFVWMYPIGLALGFFIYSVFGYKFRSFGKGTVYNVRPSNSGIALNEVIPVSIQQESETSEENPS
jgi:hypothetical protein